MAVSTVCTEHGISAKSFYELRKRAKSDGPAAVLEPGTRRPKSSPSKIGDEVKAQAVAMRAALEASGLDHGPISVYDKMRAVGLERVPSTASLARIFREAGVARLSRRGSRDRHGGGSSVRPNACWQLDGTEYVLDIPDAVAMKRHRSPDTPTVTDLPVQNCHPCPKTSHNLS